MGSRVKDKKQGRMRNKNDVLSSWPQIHTLQRNQMSTQSYRTSPYMLYRKKKLTLGEKKKAGISLQEPSHFLSWLVKFTHWGVNSPDFWVTSYELFKSHYGYKILPPEM